MVVVLGLAMFVFLGGGMIHTGASSSFSLVVMAFNIVHPEDSGVVGEVFDDGIGTTPGESWIPEDTLLVFPGAL